MVAMPKNADIRSEQCARAAADQRRGAAGDVAGAHLRRNGRRQRLKLLMPSASALCRAAADPPNTRREALAKAAHLHARNRINKENAFVPTSKNSRNEFPTMSLNCSTNVVNRVIITPISFHPNTPPQCGYLGTTMIFV